MPLFPAVYDKVALDNTLTTPPAVDGEITYVAGTGIVGMGEGVVETIVPSSNVGLARAIITTDGGLVYDIDGDILVKAAP